MKFEVPPLPGDGFRKRLAQLEADQAARDAEAQEALAAAGPLRGREAAQLSEAMATGQLHQLSRTRPAQPPAAPSPVPKSARPTGRPKKGYWWEKD